MVKTLQAVRDSKVLSSVEDMDQDEDKENSPVKECLMRANSLHSKISHMKSNYSKSFLASAPKPFSPLTRDYEELEPSQKTAAKK